MAKQKNKLCRLCGRQTLSYLPYCSVHRSAAPWWMEYKIIRPKKRGKRNIYPLLNDRRWIKLSRRYLLENTICLSCNQAATETDHILPVSEYPDLAYEKSNLQPLCRKCHQIKTARFEPRGLYINYKTEEIHTHPEASNDLL